MKTIATILAATAVLSFAAAPAKAQSFRELMEDVGLQKRKQEKMDFNERAPLVVPPSTTVLPPPEEGDQLAAANPNWPRDPDDLKAAEDAEKDKLPNSMRRKYQEDPAKAIYKIRAQEREEGRLPASTKSYTTTFERGVMTPEQLKEASAKNVAAPEQAYVEPERRRLTDPPPGYRQPSPAQPFGPGEKEKKKTGWLSKMNPFN